MKFALLAIVASFCAGAAYGQDLPCTTSDGSGQRAKREFVENYNAASQALTAKDWAGAVGGAALARPHAIYGQQLAALLQIEIAAYDGWGSQASLRSKLEAGIDAPCMAEAVRAKYRQMLAALRGPQPAPQQQ